MDVSSSNNLKMDLKKSLGPEIAAAGLIGCKATTEAAEGKGGSH